MIYNSVLEKVVGVGRIITISFEIEIRKKKQWTKMCQSRA